MDTAGVLSRMAKESLSLGRIALHNSENVKSRWCEAMGLLIGSVLN